VLNIIDYQIDPKKSPWRPTEALLASYLRLSFQNTCHTVILIIDFLPMFIYQHEMMGRMGINRTDSGCSFYKIFLKIVIISKNQRIALINLLPTPEWRPLSSRLRVERALTCKS
jgi:hypothetical protein